MKGEKAVSRVLPGLFLSLTLFLFSPAQIYLTNADEFWFTPAQLFPVLGLFALGLTPGLTLLLFVLRGAASRMAECLLHTLTLLLYLQSNFLLIQYGTLNGSAVDWGAFTAPMLLSDALWALLLTAAVLLCLRKGEKTRKFLRLAAGLAVLAQALSLCTSLLSQPPAAKEEPRYLSKAGEFRLSEKQNTLVFLLDCFDARLFMNLQEADPAWADSTLRDFIFLPDTVGGATRTKYAIPFILTGKTNLEIRSYSEYLSAEYPASPLIRALEKTGADAALYTNKLFVDLSLDPVLGNIAGGTGKVSSPAGLAGDFLKLTAFRCVPASLARFFLMYTGDFERWKETGAEGEYALNDPLFYQELREGGLEAEGEAPCFRFYHLTGAHDPYTMDENALFLPDASGTEENQALGCFRIISDYLARVKELGLWENTTVLIMADHGNRVNYEGEEQNPLFLIHPAGHTGPFTVSDMPFSYASLPALLAEAVETGSVNPTAWESEGDRYFYVEREDSIRVNIGEYVIRGKAYDPAAVSETGRVFHGDTMTYTGAYTPGTELSFGRGDTARSCIVSGFWRNDGERTWTVGNRAEMRFILKGAVPSSLTLTMTYGTFDGDQRVRVLINGVCAEEYTASGEETRSIDIPREALTSRELNLVLELPDARSPLSVGQGTDERLLGLYMESLRISAPSSSLSDLPGLLLGKVMDLCCALTGSLGWAVLLFTLVSRLLLLPLSLWVHSNSLKVVRLRPAVNRLTIRHFGDRDAIAEGQAALYKKEKYRPLASLLPLFLQILLLLGVMGAIRQPRPDYSPLFLGLDLTRSAGEQGTPGLLLPLAAGLSSLVLSLAESRLTPLQRIQHLPQRLLTAGFSVGLSLYLGFFVSAGVVFYWVLSNLLAIPVQLLMNRLIPPEKQVNWQEIAETEAELKKLKNLDGALPAGERRKLRRRERADWRRFFSVENKHLVFYSESNGFYKYFGPVMEEILSRSSAVIHYITSDPGDDIFRRADNRRLKAYYIGPRKLITLFMMMDADVVVMTMPDLENYHYKRSYVRKDIRYIYMFHYPLSTHMVLHTGALDHYDEILCVGDFQVPELRRQEELYHLPPRKLEVCGYCQLDSLYRDFRAMKKEPQARPAVLVAPSWQPDNILDSCLDPLLKGLLGRGWDVTVRPHPEYMKRFRPAMEEIQRRWADYQGGDLFFETDFTSSRSIYASDVVITDWSGTAAEFSFVTLRPCLYIDTPPKINNPRYTELGLEPREFSLRSRIGLRLSPAEAGQAGERVADLLGDAGPWQEKIRSVREELIAHFPDSAPYSARAILEAVLEQQQRRKEEQHEEEKG